MTSPRKRAANASLPPHVAPLRLEILRLIAVHGSDAVRREVKVATKRRRGPKEADDWPLLDRVIQADARDWLAGRDPFALRSQKGVAREITKQNPGHNDDSTMRRIERKLARYRRAYMLAVALEVARVELPISDYFRALEELAKVDSGDSWRIALALDQQLLAHYREVYGEPDPLMTWQELEAKPRYPRRRAPLPDTSSATRL